MRTLLNLAHCHGAVLGTSWQLVLATLQVLPPHAYLLATTHICTHSHVIRRHIQIHFMYKCTKLFLHCLHCALSTSQRESGIILSTFTKKYMSFSMLVYFFKT